MSTEKPTTEPLWNSNDVAGYLGFSVSHFTQRIENQAGFPKPVRVCGNRGKRWFPEEIRLWLLQRRSTDKAGHRQSNSLPA